METIKKMDFGVLKTERNLKCLHVPLRIGRRKLCCSCGFEFRVYKNSRDFLLKCNSCGQTVTASLNRFVRV